MKFVKQQAERGIPAILSCSIPIELASKNTNSTPSFLKSFNVEKSVKLSGVVKGFSLKPIAFPFSNEMEAKGKKDFATSDLIRDELKAINIQLQDSKEGTTWTHEK